MNLFWDIMQKLLLKILLFNSKQLLLLISISSVITFVFYLIHFDSFPANDYRYLYFGNRSLSKDGEQIHTLSSSGMDMKLPKEYIVQTFLNNDLCGWQHTFQSKQQTINQDQANVRMANYSHRSIIINNISENIYFYEAYARLIKNISGWERFDPTTASSASDQLPMLKQYSITVISIVDRQIYCSDQLINNILELVVAKFDCIFHSPHSDQKLKSTAQLSCIPEHHEHHYTAAIISCSITTMIGLKSVKIVSKASGLASDWLTIRYTNEKQDSVSSVVCVRALFGSINVLNILEFISYYRLNGFNRIVFYHYNPYINDNGNENDTDNYNNNNNNNYMADDLRDVVGVNGSNLNKINRFLKLLHSLPDVELKLFPLPKKLQENIHAGGQLVTINDCLNQYPFSVQLHVDIDEFVFINEGRQQPKQMTADNQQPNTIMQLIKGLYWSKLSFVAVSLANVFHCHEFNLATSQYYEWHAARCRLSSSSGPNKAFCSQNFTMPDNRLPSHHYSKLWQQSALLVPNSIYCQKTIWNHFYRSKVIVLRPWLVKQMGIHQVWMFVENTEMKFYQMGDSDSILTSLLINLSLSSLLALFISKWFGFHFTHQFSQTIVNYAYADSDQLVLRHFRWCCNVKQNYFMNLMHFDTANDQILKCLPDVRTNFWSRIEQNVLKQYARYLDGQQPPIN